MKATNLEGVPATRPDMEYVSGPEGHPAKGLDISKPESWAPSLRQNNHGLTETMASSQQKDAFSRVPNEAVNILSNHLTRHDAVLTADGTGTGKTSQLFRTGYLSLIDQAKGGDTPKKALLAVPEHLVKETVSEASLWLATNGKKLPWADQFEVISHQELAKRLAVPDAEKQMKGVGYLGVDEAHELLRIPGAANNIEKKLGDCKKLYATANAFETPDGAAFFIGQLEGKSSQQAEKELGMRAVGKGKMEYSDSTVDLIEKKRHTLTHSGGMVRRERPFWGKIGVEVSDANKEFSETLRDALATQRPNPNDHEAIAKLTEEASHQASTKKKIAETLSMIQEDEKQGRKTLVYGSSDFLKKLATEINRPETGIKGKSTHITDADSREAKTAKLAEFTGKPPRDGQELVKPTSSIILLPESMAAGINGLNQGKIAKAVGDSATRHMIITSLSSAGDLMQELGRLGRPDTTHPSLATVLTTNTPTDQIDLAAMKNAVRVANKTNGGPVLESLNTVFQEAQPPVKKQENTVTQLPAQTHGQTQSPAKKSRAFVGQI